MPEPSSGLGRSHGKNPGRAPIAVSTESAWRTTPRKRSKCGHEPFALVRCRVVSGRHRRRAAVARDGANHPKGGRGAIQTWFRYPNRVTRLRPTVRTSCRSLPWTEGAFDIDVDAAPSAKRRRAAGPPVPPSTRAARGTGPTTRRAEILARSPAGQSRRARAAPRVALPLTGAHHDARVASAYPNRVRICEPRADWWS
jgi:hypothetical protein